MLVFVSELVFVRVFVSVLVFVRVFVFVRVLVLVLVVVVVPHTVHAHRDPSHEHGHELAGRIRSTPSSGEPA